MATAVLNRADEMVRNSVLHQLDFEPEFNADGIGVAVEDGVVTLTGYLPQTTDAPSIWEASMMATSVGAIASSGNT